jgi:hypothetical protein
MGRPNHTFIPVEQRLKEVRESQTYFFHTIEEMEGLISCIPYEDLPLYLNVNVRWVDEDCYMHDFKSAWLKHIKERLRAL